MDSTSGITRRRLLGRSAAVGGVLVWATPVVTSFVSPAYGQVGSEQPQGCGGIMTGGGFLDGPDGKVNWDIRKMECPPLVSSPELKVFWDTGKGKNAKTYNFETVQFGTRTCSDNPAIPNGPNANWDTFDGTATGTLTINGVDQPASITFRFVDGGEGGHAADTVLLIIVGDQAGQVLNIDVVNNGGNVQAHAEGVCVLLG